MSTIGKTWKSKKHYADLGSSKINATVFVGDNPQAAWSYLTSKHPTEAIQYPGLVYLGVQKQSLGSSNSLPNYSFEILGFYSLDGSHPDINPKDLITDAITNSQYGLNLSGSLLDLTEYERFCSEIDFLISAAFTESKPFYEHIQDICKMTFSEPIWHDGSVLKIVPYYDQVIGNYTPNVAPRYYLDDNDFICDSEDDPVKIRRLTPADAFNEIQVEYKDRSNDYNTAVVGAQDLANITQYGLRHDDPLKFHYFKTVTRARLIAQLILQKGLYLRNEYDFILPANYCLLEPMDIVAITDSILGLDDYLVRIVRIEETETGDLNITAEDFPQNVSSSGSIPSDDPGGFVPNYEADPGDINTPIIFNAPSALTITGYEIWCAVSGSGVNWGGCDIYLSTDDETYTFVSHVEGGARYGTTTDTFASGSDPDTTNHCLIDLTTSEGELLTVVQSDADNKNSLCLVEDELISYTTATLGLIYNYTLEDYIRRGQYGTAIVSHATSSRFVRLDSAIIKIPYDPDLTGQTIYIKFASFNIYNTVVQDLAILTPYTFTIGSSLGNPSNVTGFTASQSSGNVNFSWTPVTDMNLAGYEIRYGAHGVVTWATGTVVGLTGKTSSFSAPMPTPGDYDFLICAKDNTEKYSITPASYNLVITTYSFVFSSITDSGLTVTRITYAGTAGILTDSANIVTDGNYVQALGFKGAYLKPVSDSTTALQLQNAGGTNILNIDSTNTRIGINVTAPLRGLDVNEASGNCLRLIYNDSDGSAANYGDFLLSSTGDLTINASGGDIDFGDENLSTTGSISADHLHLTNDLAVAEGGTGASTAQAAIDALTAVAGATNEHVLTKDTVTGNAIFKAAVGGYVHPNHSGDVTSVADGATTIAAKAIHVAMFADGTDGELITWDSDGVAAVIAAGTATHVLTSNGAGAAPTFQAPAAAVVADGDKGDITVSGSGATWTIDAGVVTLAKMTNMATDSLIYRRTAGAGAPEVNSRTQLKTDLALAQADITGLTTADSPTFVNVSSTGYMYSYGDNAAFWIFKSANPPILGLRHCGGTFAAKTQTLAIQEVSKISGGAWETITPGWQDIVDISFWTAEAQTPTNFGSYMDFRTSPIGAAGRTLRLRIDSAGNLLLGGTVADASAVGVLTISNKTAPAAHVDNAIQIYSVDSADGTAAIGEWTEQGVEAIGTFTATKKIKRCINGVWYWQALDAV